MNPLGRPLLAVTLFLSFTHASASKVYRCPQADGGVLFQQTACSQGEVLRIESPAVGWSGLRPAEKAQLQKDRPPTADKARSAAARGSQTDWQGRGESKACWGRRQRLEKARAKLRRGYAPAEGERLRRQRDEHEDYLRRFC